MNKPIAEITVRDSITEISVEGKKEKMTDIFDTFKQEIDIPTHTRFKYVWD